MFKPKNIKIMLILLVGSVLFWLIYALLNSLNAPPKILSITPKNESVDVDPTLPITITTDKEVEFSDFSISSNPSAKFSIEKSGEKTYTFTPYPSLHTNSQYTIYISYKSKKISAIMFNTFKSESDPSIMQEAEIFMKNNYPLAKYLPIKTDTYQLYYLKEKTLGITKLSDVMSDDDARNIAKKFLTDHNDSSNIHTIVVVDGKSLPKVTKVESTNE